MAASVNNPNGPVVQLKSPNGTVLYISGAPTYQLADDYVGDDDTKSTYIYTNQCEISGATIRSRELHLHTSSITVLSPESTLDTSGQDGIPNIQADSTAADAGDASPLWISTPEFRLPTSLEVKATGGNGGPGFASTVPPPTIPSSTAPSPPPGIGGRAGNGADISFMVNTEYDLIAEQAEAIVADPKNANDKIKAMLAWAEKAQRVTSANKPDGISWVYTMKIDTNQPNMDPGDSLPHTISPKTFLGLMEITIRTLRQIAAEFLSAVDTRPGIPGHGGIEAASARKAADGNDGKAGICTTITYSPQQILAGTELIFHPDQVGITIRDIENDYFIGTQDSIGEAISKLKDLTSRLGFLQAAKPTDSLYQAYIASEYKTLAVLPSGTSGVSAAFNSLNANLRLAKHYMVQINQGYDFYRHVDAWVPCGSYESYDKSFSTLLADFDDVENNYNDYQKLLEDNSSRSEQIQKAINAARSGEKQATADLNTLGKDLSVTASRIATLQEDIPRKHEAVDKKLIELGDKIKSDVQRPRMKEFLGALGQMAFCSSPKMAAVMGLAQGGTLLNSSINEIHDSAGNEVEKDYVVQKIRVLKNGVDGLKEALEASANDPKLDIDDPAASKLLGQEDQIMTLIEDYRSALGNDVDDFKKVFDDFASTVIQRNNLVIHYNNVVSVFLQTKAKLDLYIHDQHALNTQEAQLHNSPIPGLASIIKSSYLDYTSKVLELLYDTQRALTFWTLDSGSVQIGSLRDDGFPSKGLGATLKSLRGALIKDFMDQMNGFGIGRSPFGITAGSGGKPKVNELDSVQLDLLKLPPRRADQEFFTTIDVDHATKDTSINQNVFAGNADVRISCVRVFLDGAKTADGILKFTLHHLGDETMVTVEDQARRFTHDRLTFPYEYDTKTKIVTRDGRLDLDPSYALPGPFATWRIGLSPVDNMNLDLSNVTGGRIEFSGWSRSFR